MKPNRDRGADHKRASKEGYLRSADLKYPLPPDPHRQWMNYVSASSLIPEMSVGKRTVIP